MYKSELSWFLDAEKSDEFTIEDICSKMDAYLIENDYLGKDREGIRQLVDSGLKRYLISKIQELNESEKISTEMDLDVGELVAVLAKLIPQEKHDDTLRHCVYAILNLIGTMQGYSVLWWIESDEDLIENPSIDSNEFGEIDRLVTHQDTSYVRAFNHVYEAFNIGMGQKKSAKKLNFPSSTDGTK